MELGGELGSISEAGITAARCPLTGFVFCCFVHEEVAGVATSVQVHGASETAPHLYIYLMWKESGRGCCLWQACVAAVKR